MAITRVGKAEGGLHPSWVGAVGDQATGLAAEGWITLDLAVELEHQMGLAAALHKIPGGIDRIRPGLIARQGAHPATALHPRGVVVAKGAGRGGCLAQLGCSQQDRASTGPNAKQAQVEQAP